MNERLENSKRKLEEDLNDMNIKMRGFNEIKAQLEMNKTQLLAAEKTKTETHNNFANKLKEITQLVTTLEKQNKDLTHEKVLIICDSDFTKTWKE